MACASSGRRPNLVVIMTDQQRWDAVGVYGNSVIRTPNLDRLGREGIVFERAYAVHPKCMPARAALVTGQPVGCPRVYDGSSIADPDATVPARLGQAGYTTQGIGKFHFLPVMERRLNGFDDIVFSEETRWVRSARSAEQCRLDDYDRYLAERSLFGWDKPQEIGYNEIKPTVNRLPKAHHVTQWCGDQTVSWLKRGPSEPYLLWCSFVKPHAPYDAPHHLRDLYDPEDMPEPWRAEGELDRWRYYRELNERHEINLYSDLAKRRSRAAYYANITFIDEQVGRILDAIEASGQADNTYVIFTSDHGDMLGDHDLWYKNMGYDGSVRVPMMVWAPGHVAGGQRVSTPVGHLDIPVTLLDLAGVDGGQSAMPGENLLDIAAGKVDRDCVISTHTGYYACHRRWKYCFYPNGGYEELFDLEHDPRELTNVAEEPAHAEVKAELHARLVAWQRRYVGGKGVGDDGRLAVRPYVGPAADEPLPFSRMPWEARVPPAVLLAEGRASKVGWWWRTFGMSLASLLPASCQAVSEESDINERIEEQATRSS